MGQRMAYLRVWVEAFLAFIIGSLITWKSSWCDPDEGIAFYWHAVLLAVGFVFGLFGQCRIWIIALAMGGLSIYAALVPMRWAFWLELVLFAWMFTIVLIGAAIGRAMKRYWTRKRAKHDAGPKPISN
jgi:hypothetical protein